MEGRRLAHARHQLGHSLAGTPNALAARSATLPVLRAALIAGNESGRGSVAHRADHVTLPSMVQRNQRNHFPPPVLTGPIAPRFVTGEVSQPPQRSQYILYHSAITVNHGVSASFMSYHWPQLHPGDRFTRETAMGHCRYCGHRSGWLRSSHRQCAQLTVRVWRSWLTWWRRLRPARFHPAANAAHSGCTGSAALRTSRIPDWIW